jgi:hypothetical protein
VRQLWSTDFRRQVVSPDNTDHCRSFDTRRRKGVTTGHDQLQSRLIFRRLAVNSSGHETATQKSRTAGASGQHGRKGGLGVTTWEPKWALLVFGHGQIGFLFIKEECAMRIIPARCAHEQHPCFCHESASLKHGSNQVVESLTKLSNLLAVAPGGMVYG